MPHEVAALFGVDPKTVARWGAAGTLKPAFRTPGAGGRGHARYLTSQPEIAAVLAARSAARKEPQP